MRLQPKVTIRTLRGHSRIDGRGLQRLPTTHPKELRSGVRWTQGEWM